MILFFIGCMAGVLATITTVMLLPRGSTAESDRRSETLHADALPVSALPADERFSIVFNSVPVAIMTVRLSDGHIVDTNAAFTELWGYTRAESLGRTGNELRLWIEPARLIEQLKRNRHSDVQELQILRKDGDARDVIATVTLTQLDGSAHLLITAADVTERNSAKQLEHIASHDTLTQLPNRRMLWAALRDLRERAQEGSGVSAVLFLDLDRFKAVNDTLGHRAGDELLRLVAARLKRRLRSEDLLARIGGDEFVVVLENLGERTQAKAIADDLMQQIARPFVLADRREAHIGVSIGISYVTESCFDLEGLLEQADAALYSVKQAGRNGVKEFETHSSTSA